MAASASAYAYNPTYNVSSSAVESYAVSTPAYDASTPGYAASTSGYPVASSSVKYEEYPVTSTKVSRVESKIHIYRILTHCCRSSRRPLSSAPLLPL